MQNDLDLYCLLKLVCLNSQEKICYDKCPKFKTLYSILLGINFAFYAVVSELDMLSAIANSVNPDQTGLPMPFCQKLWCMKF